MRRLLLSLFCALVALVAAPRLATGQCAEWIGVGTPPFPNGGVNGRVNAVAVFDDGTGPALYLGGQFSAAGQLQASGIVKWDGFTFTSLGQGVSGTVKCLIVYNDGTGNALYVGGDFSRAGGNSALARLAKWNGTQWLPVGPTSINGTELRAMAIFGGALYVGGSFSVSTGSDTAVNLAAWNGAVWQRPGSSQSAQVSGRVNALQVHTDALGSNLYLGGSFSIFTSGGTISGPAARYNGTTFSGIVNSSGGEVLALASGAEAGQPALYVGGQFSSLNGQNINSLARFSQSAWSQVSSGVPGAVNALCWSGGRLCIGGSFGGLGSAANTTNLGAYDPAVGFVPVRAPVNAPSQFSGNSVSVIADVNDRYGPGLFVGGLFTRAAFANCSNAVRSYVGNAPSLYLFNSSSERVNPGETLSLIVGATGSEPLQYQWRRDGAPLFNSATIQGANSPSLLISDFQDENFGAYDCVVTNGCGSIISRAVAAGVTVPGACDADFNKDGNTDQGDVDALINVIGGGPCP